MAKQVFPFLTGVLGLLMIPCVRPAVGRVEKGLLGEKSSQPTPMASDRRALGIFKSQACRSTTIPASSRRGPW
jgi:hypothetical protein